MIAFVWDNYSDLPGRCYSFYSQNPLAVQVGVFYYGAGGENKGLRGWIEFELCL